jgi:2-keto-3-deoxy-L-rhamnonate aldolase RhmA
MSDTHSTPEEMSADQAKSFFAQAQDKVTEAVNAAIEAAKEKPKTAAAIATGAAAAVGAAAYGVTKLREGDDGSKSSGGKSDKK